MNWNTSIPPALFSWSDKITRFTTYTGVKCRSSCIYVFSKREIYFLIIVERSCDMRSDVSLSNEGNEYFVSISARIDLYLKDIHLFTVSLQNIIPVRCHYLNQLGVIT